MALGGEVDDGAGLMRAQQLRHLVTVTDVAWHQGVAGVVLQALQVLNIAGVGEFVQGDDGLIALSQPVKHEVGADEAGAAGDEDGHGVGIRSNLIEAYIAFMHMKETCIDRHQ